ncbi:SMP-30/gluconolactonase/LRE family protein [Candidatus Sulfurimonas marisnigri]|uniref:SMP-30/gluconolactonase/LRE family protein n=1 Tax=Candidatus Sulfurimonas marisnigri TaxID=2740405 RepID=A0A7S7LZQ7_9BACT|nr:6-bladed beta-propeller [Candidatus Sulfurimonas marisnigri]QOY54445.1 SMP-30/gluconolactonase/LRE family protein [Candidatus Sulfurimonas marisnigri]
MKLILAVLFIFMQLMFIGCSTKVKEIKQEMLAFPPYPDKPRIVYLDTYRGENVEEEETNLLDSITGDTSKKVQNPLIVKPYGVAFKNGKIYVVDTGTRVVFIIDEKTKKVAYLGAGQGASFVSPVSIAFDKDGIMYISDILAKKITGYQEGTLVFTLGSRLDFTAPTGIAIDKELHRLYVVDTKAHDVKAYDLATKKLLYKVGKRGNAHGEFNFPTNIAIDRRNNNFVVTDTQNFRVQIFDKDGKFIKSIGKVGDRPGDFARPKGVGIDSEGHIYVADSAFNNVQVFNQEGEIMTYFGHAGFVEPATFRLISGMYIDENDKLIIADGFSGRVQSFQYLSEKWQKNNPLKYKEYVDYTPKAVLERERKEKEKQTKKDGDK